MFQKEIEKINFHKNIIKKLKPLLNWLRNENIIYCGIYRPEVYNTHTKIVRHQRQINKLSDIITSYQEWSILNNQ